MKIFSKLMALTAIAIIIFISSSCKKTDNQQTPITGLKVGEAAPDFSLADPDGNALSLHSYRGKLVLIDFWASWCHFCRDENPILVQTYDLYKSKGFEILGISVDDNKANWLKAIDEDQITYPQLSDLKAWNSEVIAAYKVQGIPHMILLNKEGVIVLITSKAVDVRNYLEQHME